MEVEYFENNKFPIKHHHVKIMIFLAFLGVVALLIYTSFYGISFTGNVIQKVQNTEGDIQISAELTVPSLSLDGKFREVELRGGSDSYLYSGDQKFYLGNSENNFISLNNYDGKISFDSNKIGDFNGKVSNVSINGVDVESQSGKMMRIEMEDDFDYSSLEISEEVYVKDISYNTSGTIRLNGGKNLFGVENEEVSINDFKGKIVIQNGKFSLDGTATGLDISGAQGISVS